ncbi:hypothetical protein E2C01_049232 [Portunus trituberculatus]|uniref:Uncharacterized protein n=1 Tax=Portunus trituberculatus TaxID=210409 RepID=A0A5B7G532_PORTR|nr:hypothetical protein [Portunus trituberculatus]
MCSVCLKSEELVERQKVLSVAQVSEWRTNLTAGGGDPWTLQIKAAGSSLPTDSMLPMELPSLRVGLTLASVSMRVMKRTCLDVVPRSTDLTVGAGEPCTLHIKAAGSPLPTKRILPMDSPSLRVGLTLASGAVVLGMGWGEVNAKRSVTCTFGNS